MVIFLKNFNGFSSKFEKTKVGHSCDPSKNNNNVKVSKFCFIMLMVYKMFHNYNIRQKFLLFYFISFKVKYANNNCVLKLLLNVNKDSNFSHYWMQNIRFTTFARRFHRISSFSVKIFVFLPFRNKVLFCKLSPVRFK